jgi:hypothetical protein
VATPADHRAVYAELRRAGFRRVRLEYFPGAHEIDPTQLGVAMPSVLRRTNPRRRRSPHCHRHAGLLLQTHGASIEYRRRLQRLRPTSEGRPG